MFDVILVEIATVMQAVFNALQRQYQRKLGDAAPAKYAYNAFLGLFAAILFWVMCSFQVEFTPFSGLIALVQAILGVSYTLIGFKVMQMGGMVLYSLFLMVGGMMVPYVWGLLFLGEPFVLTRTLGLVLILGAVILFNSGSQKPSAKLLALCIAVFFLNGFVSVLSKLHQIETNYATISTDALVMLINVAKAVLCFVILAVLSRKRTGSAPAQKTLPDGRMLLLIAVCAILAGLSYRFQLMGAKNLPATLLYPLFTGGCLLFTSLLGLFMGEKLTKRGWAGVGMCILGTVLML